MSQRGVLTEQSGFEFVFCCVACSKSVPCATEGCRKLTLHWAKEPAPEASTGGGSKPLRIEKKFAVSWDDEKWLGGYAGLVSEDFT